MKKWIYGLIACTLISLFIVFQTKYFNKQKVMILETQQTDHAILTKAADPVVHSPVGDKMESEKAVISPTAKKTLINPSGVTLGERFIPPAGYQRMDKPLGSFQGYLREYELKPDKSPVLLHDGSEKRNQKAHAAVFSMPLVKGDLQQCADSVIRMYGEYLWSIGAFNEISFQLTNGFLMDYPSWREGKRLAVEGNKVWWEKRASYDDSKENLLKYLRQVMIYAGTISLDRESSSIALNQLLSGDLLIRGGSPGHCVMVVDVAEDAAGNKCFLLAQGYMPAQDFHVLNNPLHEDDPWYYVTEIQDTVITPEYTFGIGDLKRWKTFME